MQTKPNQDIEIEGEKGRDRCRVNCRHEPGKWTYNSRDHRAVNWDLLRGTEGKNGSFYKSCHDNTASIHQFFSWMHLVKDPVSPLNCTTFFLLSFLNSSYHAGLNLEEKLGWRLSGLVCDFWPTDGFLMGLMFSSFVPLWMGSKILVSPDCHNGPTLSLHGIAHVAMSRVSSCTL